MKTTSLSIPIEPEYRNELIPDWVLVTLNINRNVYLNNHLKKHKLADVVNELELLGYTKISTYSPEFAGGCVIRAKPPQNEQVI